MGTTLGFVAAGAAGGAITALLSHTLVWLGLTPLSPSFASGWVLTFIAAVGAVFGAILTPVFGWLLVNRVGFWPAVLAPTVGAILGENLAAMLLSSLQTDVLVAGAFVGAVIAVLTVRLGRPAGRAQTLTGER